MKGGTLTPDLSFEQFSKIVQTSEGPVKIPVTVTFRYEGPSPAAVFSLFREERGFLLESMEGVPRRATRSILSTGPVELLALDDRAGKTEEDPLAFLRAAAGPSCPVSAPAGFCGGLVGYCTYDLASAFHPGRLDAGREEGRPLARFMRVTDGLVFSHPDRTCTSFATRSVSPEDDPDAVFHEARASAERTAQKALFALPEEPLPSSGEPVPVAVSDTEKTLFYDQVRSVLGHIRAGDTFQTVISAPFSSPCPGDPFRVYQEVRRLNPSPYLYYLDFGDEAVIGSSPEMLVKVEGRTVSTVPIAGTRPRGPDAPSDERLAQELLADEKERAEHLMLVDLARNDIGRVSCHGSVQVSSFMEVEKFSHVQHLTSRVHGRLRDDCDRFDAFAACFPAGTVTGAPKLRAMQIIADLEKRPRGLYAGAVGYIGLDDRLEFAIAIRTMTVRDGTARFQAGAGIVADSDPVRELEETCSKAQVLGKAIGRAGGRA